MRYWTLGLLALLFPALLGLSSTLYWLHRDGAAVLAGADPVSLVLLLVALSAMTVIQLCVRWFRWHFLTRRLGVRLLTRESFKVYFATLPLMLTPLYCGEALRGALFARRDRHLYRVGGAAWAIERLGDAAALATWGLMSAGLWGWSCLAAAATVLGAAAGLSKIERSVPADRHPGGSWLTALTFTGVSMLAWCLPIVGLWGGLRQFGVSVGLGQAGVAFATSTIIGALTGIPAGQGVSGTLLIMLLEQDCTDASVLPWVVAVFRFGTVWVAVGLGVVLLFRWRCTLMSIIKGMTSPDHFDDISAHYGDEIPEHVRERLLSRKVRLMVQRLESRGDRGALRGLDLGCGQGWYACAMAEEGYSIVAIDMSARQIRSAEEYARRRRLRVEFAVASATKLPFGEHSFDFVYSINVVHHILSEEDRWLMFSEIKRVLKPGGVFILNEINTTNPLFRFYMSYLFPLLNSIDEGNERWVMPGSLPKVEGARWSACVEYFTFLPDFIPEVAQRLLLPLERWLEESVTLQRYSAHYLACLQTDDCASSTSIAPQPTAVSARLRTD